eukprot:scaffold92116_cov29-Tisochrysis_lutea.AAC.6
MAFTRAQTPCRSLFAGRSGLQVNGLRYCSVCAAVENPSMHNRLAFIRYHALHPGQVARCTPCTHRGPTNNQGAEGKAWAWGTGRGSRTWGVGVAGQWSMCGL